VDRPAGISAIALAQNARRMRTADPISARELNAGSSSIGSLCASLTAA